MQPSKTSSWKVEEDRGASEKQCGHWPWELVSKPWPAKAILHKASDILVKSGYTGTWHLCQSLSCAPACTSKVIHLSTMAFLRHPDSGPSGDQWPSTHGMCSCDSHPSPRSRGERGGKHVMLSGCCCWTAWPQRWWLSLRGTGCAIISFIWCWGQRLSGLLSPRSPNSMYFEVPSSNGNILHCSCPAQGSGDFAPERARLLACSRSSWRQVEPTPSALAKHPQASSLQKSHSVQSFLSLSDMP